MNHTILSILISTFIMIIVPTVLLIKSIKKHKKLNTTKLDFKYAIIGQKVIWKHKNKHKYKGVIIDIDFSYNYPIQCEFIKDGKTYTQRFRLDGSDEYYNYTLSYAKIKSKQNFKKAKIGQIVKYYYYNGVYVGTIIDIQPFADYPICCKFKELPNPMVFNLEGIEYNTAHGHIEYPNRIISILNYINNIINNIKHDFRPFEKPKLDINKINKKNEIQVKIEPEIKIIITNN